MIKKLFVGNLSWNITDEDLNQLFGQHAEVISARVATDRDTNRSRGFGFVEVPADAAEAVISAMDGYMLDGRAINVNEARPREDRPGRSNNKSYGSRW
jgi:RNA recognition motif-containing protein